MTTAAKKPVFLSHVNGLRAIAILGILFYHLNSAYCPAGYFGVDAFLIISGYFLLASLLKAESPGDIHYGSYLLKKSWRILIPWLAVTFVFCFGSVDYVLPADRDTMCCTSARGAFFGTEFLINNLFDFLNQIIHINFFLHIWYLSLICQMYIFLPLLVMLLLWLGRGKKLLVGVLAVFGLLSLALYALTTEPQVPESIRKALLSATGMKTAYYHLLPRMWEVLLGGVVLLLPAWQERPRLRMLLESLSMIALIASFFWYETGTPRVYVAAIAALLFIRYGGEGPVSRLLAWKPVQWIGTISFSLYLWHWPIMVGWKYVNLGQVFWYDELGMVLLSLLMAAISWALLERLRMPKSKAWWAWCVRFLPLAILIAFGASIRPYYKSIRADANAVFKTQGLLGDVIKMLEKEPGDDAIRRGYNAEIYPKCPVYIGKEVEGPPSFIIIGDSHSSHLWLGADRYCREHGEKGILFLNHITPFWYCYKTEQSEWDEKRAESLLDYLRRQEEVKYVFICMLWNARLYGDRSSNGGITMDWREMKQIPLEEQIKLREEGLAETCRRISALGKRVVILGDIPTLPNRPSPYEQWLKIKMLTGEDCPEYLAPVSRHMEQSKRSYELYKRLVEQGDAWAMIDCAEALREGDSYRTRNDEGKFLYFDFNHVTQIGSERVADYFMNEWKRLKQAAEAAPAE